MQIREFALELDEPVILSRKCCGCRRPRSHAGRGLDHCVDHLRVLPHVEIVVGAPDHDVAWALQRVPNRVREPAGDPLEIREHAVPPLVAEPSDRIREEFIVRHRFSLLARTRGPKSSFEKDRCPTCHRLASMRSVFLSHEPGQIVGDAIG